jgi:hypothetical protein
MKSGVKGTVRYEKRGQGYRDGEKVGFRSNILNGKGVTKAAFKYRTTDTCSRVLILADGWSKTENIFPRPSTLTLNGACPTDVAPATSDSYTLNKHSQTRQQQPDSTAGRAADWTGPEIAHRVLQVRESEMVNLISLKEFNHPSLPNSACSWPCMPRVQPSDTGALIK